MTNLFVIDMATKGKIIGDNTAIPSQIIKETPEIQKNAIRQLEAALDLLPIETRQAYSEALVKCPHVIATESNPIVWLRYEHYNVWDAARRLVRYWEYRKELFQERAYLPILDLMAKETAFDDADSAILSTGVLVQLPFSADNESTQYETIQERRHVLFSDRTRLRGKTLEISQSMRIAFYFFNRAITLDITKQIRNKILVIDLMHFLPKNRVGFLSLKMGREAFPAHLEPILIAIPYTKKRSYFQEFFPNIIKRWGEHFKKDYCSVEIGESKLDLQRKLEAHGIKRNCLPQSVGGTWSYDEFESWFESERKPHVSEGLDEPNVRSNEVRVDDLRLKDPSVETESRPFKKTRARKTNAVRAQEAMNNFSLIDDSERHNQVDLDRLGRLNDALKMIPWAERGVFMEAIDHSSNLAVTDGCALQFLKHENDDAAHAAHRLVSYWRKRKDLYGDLTFVPMKSWNRQQLNFATNNFSVLPAVSSRPILLVDASRLTSQSETDDERYMFYCLSMMVIQYDVTQGVDVILMISEDNLESALKQTAFARARTFFPLKLESLHVVVRSAQLQLLRYPMIASRILAIVIGEVGNEVHFHSGYNTLNFSESLTQRGIDQESLPSVLTGEGDNHPKNLKHSPKRQIELKLTLRHNLHGSRLPANTEPIEKHLSTDSMDESKDEDEFDSKFEGFPKPKEQLYTTGSILNNSVQATRQLCLDAYTRYVGGNDDVQPCKLRDF